MTNHSLTHKMEQSFADFRDELRVKLKRLIDEVEAQDNRFDNETNLAHRDGQVYAYESVLDLLDK